MKDYSSKLIEEAISELSKLPGIGKKTALRLALFILQQDESYADSLGNAVVNLRKNVRYCEKCFNISDSNTCEICANPNRDSSVICVVEDIMDVMAIENTGQFKGLYHVLGGIISPIDGIGPAELNIESLVQRLGNEDVGEVIFALPTTVEGDTTNFYLFKRLKEFNVKITTLSRGVAIGDELEYADEVTLGRSILHRLPYEQSFGK